MEYIKEAIKFYLKKYLNIVKNIFSLDMPLDENGNRLKVYDISDEDIKEFFKHLKLSKKDYYTIDYFYKWHREHKDRNE